MKTLADAFSLRNRVIEMLERAELEDDPLARQADLTFVVGGGGLSGVETAGELEDFVRRVRRRYYPKIAQSEIHTYLVELKNEVLAELPPEMGAFARRRLERRGFDVRLGTAIREVREAEVVIGDGDVIPTRTVVWTGGVRPAPMVARSGVEVDHAGRVKTLPTMETSRSTAFAITSRHSSSHGRTAASSAAPRSRSIATARCCDRSPWRHQHNDTDSATI